MKNCKWKMENPFALLCARLYTALDSRATTNEFDTMKMHTKAPIVTGVDPDWKGDPTGIAPVPDQNCSNATRASAFRMRLTTCFNVGIYSSYCNAIRMGISPWPSISGRNALPITAPNALSGSSTLIAYPGVGEVVNKSPTLIAPN